MFKWLKGIFMDKSSNQTRNTATRINLPVEVLDKIKVPRKFEIFVEQYDEEGGPKGRPCWKPVSIDSRLGGNGGNPVITVTSRADLEEKRKTFADIGQRFKLVREIDPPTPDQIIEMARQQGVDVDKYAVEQRPQAAALPQAPGQQEQAQGQAQEPEPAQKPRQKPKIVSIGDMQIKYDNGKIYQRQWITLSGKEAENFRVINSQNNKIISMAGKAIQAKRWILVEETQGEEDETEKIING